jgi:hypothetical protein
VLVPAEHGAERFRRQRGLAEAGWSHDIGVRTRAQPVRELLPQCVPAE